MTASGHARRDFCRMLAGMAAVAALPLPASAGDFDDGMAAWARGDLRAAITAWEAALRGAKEPALRVELLVRLASAHRELGELGRARGRLAEAEAMGLLLAARIDRTRAQWSASLGRPEQASLREMALLERVMAQADRLARLGPDDADLLATSASLARWAAWSPSAEGVAVTLAPLRPRISLACAAAATVLACKRGNNAAHWAYAGPKAWYTTLAPCAT